jgi:hypothetical protein
LQFAHRFFFLVTFMFGVRTACICIPFVPAAAPSPRPSSHAVQDAIFTLPSSTIRCGFWPYAAAMAINLSQQLASTWLLLEVMQRYALFSTRDAPGLNPRRQPGYHMLGMAYLPPLLVAFLHSQFFLGYLSPVVAQTVTGSGSFATVLGVSQASLVVPFYVPCAIAVLFFPRISQPILAAMGVVRLAVLCCIVGGFGSVLYASSPPDIAPTTAWDDIVSVYGPVTFVLGGMSSVFPAITTAAAITRRDGSDARSLWWVSVAALAFITSLCLSWGFVVLHIVPQTEAGARALGWPVDYSIEWSAARGELTTVPALKVLRAFYPSLVGALPQLLTAYYLSLFSSWFGNYVRAEEGRGREGGRWGPCLRVHVVP